MRLATNVVSGSRPMGGRARRSRGFTMVELMVALLVLAILLAMAVPSFRDATLSSRLTGYANDLVASAQIARSEAIKRNVGVTLCASTNGTSCAADVGWEVGWIILAPRQEVVPPANPGDPPTIITVMDVVQRHEPLASEFLFTEASGVTEIDFPPTVVGVTPATFTVCRAQPVGSQERVVTIISSGATSVARTTTGDCSDD